ncbi:hypothetical protein PULV_a0386 [Pseudoalteromonas ulvae UL12]|nr:hypothetical protein [Pseudoalteromonas ulvae UL12]
MLNLICALSNELKVHCSSQDFLFYLQNLDVGGCFYKFYTQS